jgi:hypothetical protein
MNRSRETPATGTVTVPRHDLGTASMRSKATHIALINFYLGQRKFDNANAAALTSQQVGAESLEAEDDRVPT